MTRASRIQWAWLTLWGTIAVVGLGRSFLTSLHPPNSTDLLLVVEWTRQWLWSSTSAYTGPWPTSDYPPHALVFLSPLTLVPVGWLPFAWSAFNVALAPLCGALALRLAAPGASGMAVALPIAMFLGWFGLRVGLRAGQFSLLSFTLGLLAVAVGRTRPRLGGVLLGLSLVKLHVAGAILLWALLTRRFQMAAMAVATAAGGTLLFSLRLGESPVETIGAYLAVLRGRFGGVVFQQGWLELRPLIRALIPDVRAAEVAHLVILGGALAAVLVAATRPTGAARERDVHVLGACCAFTLLAVFHHPYDLIVLLPVMASLGVACGGLGRGRISAAAVIYALAQLLLVVDVLALVFRLEESFRLATTLGGLAWLRHADRILVAGLFGVSLWLLRPAPTNR